MLYYRESMTPSDDNKTVPEGSSDSDESIVKIDASGDDALDMGNEDVDGVFAEIASEVLAEQKEKAAQGAPKAQTATQKDQAAQDDRLALRERLLKSAPKEQVMRAQVLQALESKKSALESEIRELQKTEEYDLLSAAVAQLRAVIRQLQIVARAGYEALKEIWLKVVHKLA